MNLKLQDKYNAVVLELSGKLMGGPFFQELNETLHKLIDEGKKNIVVDIEIRWDSIMKWCTFLAKLYEN